MIGATDAETEGQWIDFNGSPLNYTNWQSGQPNNLGGGQDYVGYYAGNQAGGWDDHYGTHSNHVLCEKSCPAGWDMHTIENKNKCLKNVGESNAKTALTLCQDLNAVLPVVQTKGCF